MIEQNIEVDENDNVIGLRPRDDFYTGNYIHRSSHLILFNNNNEILIQKRAPDKKWYPNLYTYSVSETVADESYEDAIKKGMEEELGISIPAKYLFKYPVLDKLDKAFHAVFVGKTEQFDVKPDKREMTEIIWMDADELRKDIEAHPEKYTPTSVPGFKKFFEEFYSSLKL